MKIILSLCLLALTTIASGINPQDGGGTNVCSRYRSVVLLDEFVYGRIVQLNRWDSTSPANLVLRKNDSFILADLTKVPGLAEAHWKKMRRLKRKLRTPELINEIWDFSNTLDAVFLHRSTFDGSYETDENLRVNCYYPKTLLFSSPKGYSIVDEEMWDKLIFPRKEILLIHEGLRLAHFYSPFFHHLSNEELSELTMMIYFGHTTELEMHPAWKRAESSISSFSYPSDLNSEITEIDQSILQLLKWGRPSEEIIPFIWRKAALMKAQDKRVGQPEGMHFSSELKKVKGSPSFWKSLEKLASEDFPLKRN